MDQRRRLSSALLTVILTMAGCSEDTRSSPDAAIGDHGPADQASVTDSPLDQAVDHLLVPDASLEAAHPTAWTAVATASRQLRGIWGTSANNIYVVGKQGLILHYDGQSWTPMSNGSDKDLHAVWGPADNVVYAAGDDIILGYDGRQGPASWEELFAPSFLTFSFRGIWGSSAEDVWFVSQEGLIKHKTADGAGGWATEKIVVPSALEDIWGHTTETLMVVGEDGLIMRRTADTSWTKMPSGTSHHLTSIWGSSPQDVYAVGLHGTVLHFDGTDWRSLDLGSASYFYDVWGSSADQITIAGEGFFDPAQAVFVYEGQQWSPLQPAPPTGLRGVWRLPTTDLYGIAKLKVYRFTPL